MFVPAARNWRMAAATPAIPAPTSATPASARGQPPPICVGHASSSATPARSAPKVSVGGLAITPGLSGKHDLELGAAAVARPAAHVSAVGARDLPHEREAEAVAASPSRARPAAGRTARRSARARSREPRVRGRPRAAARPVRGGSTRAVTSVPPAWRRALSSRLRTSRRSRRASPRQLHGLAGDDGVGARGFLGDQAQEVHELRALRRSHGLEPARFEQLGDERVELRDVARGARAHGVVAPQQLERDPQPRERRAQLVGREGELRRCASTSPSMRSAARLKLRARSRPRPGPRPATRAARSPRPRASTRDCRRSSLRVSRRTSGHAPTPTASARSASVASSPRPCWVGLARGHQPPPVRQLDREQQVAADAATSARGTALAAAAAERPTQATSSPPGE